MYSLVKIKQKKERSQKENKKAKGVNRGVVRDIKYKKFVNFLFGGEVMRHRIKGIQSKLHRIGIYDVCKISLFCFDDKKYILDDAINILAFFHKDIRSQWECKRKMILY